MVFVVLSIDGTQEVQLVPEIVYRIGRRFGVEFYKDDESIELVHAWVGVIADGVVRISAVAGKTYVDEKEIEAKSISESDAVNGLVILRFGNVRAQLRFKRDLDAEAILESSGYDEEVKNKTTNTTADSSFIPETRPPSTNTTRDGESFMIPETQAVSISRPSIPNETSRISVNDEFLIPETQDVLPKNPVAQKQNIDTACKDNKTDLETETQEISFTRPSTPNKQSKRPLDEDFVIPETQDVLFINPVAQSQNADIACRDDESELGTQIRICTQDFYNSDEDAIDDFDSSILLEDGKRAVNHTAKQQEDKVGIELEMSTLNWCANNSSFTAINSTAKNVCLTPEHKLSAHDDVPCTPDFLDAFQTLETPDPTPAETGDNSQDFIETQVFPVMNLNNEGSNTQDFIATQKFEIGKHLQNSNVDTSNEDFIETQILPPQKLLLESSLPNEAEDNSQAFIKTQAFIRKDLTCKSTQQDPHHTVLNVSALIHTTTEDMIETQVFIRPTDNTITRTEKVDDMRLTLSDSISISDKLDKELKKLMDISSLPSSPSDVEEYNRNVDIINEDKKRLAVNKLNSAQSTAQKCFENTASSSKAMNKSATPPVSKDALPKKRIKVETKSPLVVLKTLRKRSLVQNAETAEASITKSSKTPKIDLKFKVAKHESTECGPKKDQTCSTSLQSPLHCKDVKVSLKKPPDTKVLSSKRERKAGNESKGFMEKSDEHFPPNQSTTSKEFKIKDTKTKKQNDLELKAVTTSDRKLTKKHKKAEVKEIDRLIVGESEPSCSMELINDDGCESKISEQQLLKDINAYVKKIKKSGRKIQLTFSRCNLAELRLTLFSLKNVIEVTENPQYCDVLIMDKGERTYKFLMGVALNKPILSTRWLLSVQKTHSIDVKPEHLFSDDKFEQSYKFKPLLVMHKPKLLKGLGFMLGSTIQPSAKDMKAIIECAGGSVHSKAPSFTCNAPLYVVLEKQDQYFEKQIKKCNNVQYIKTEAIMQALVQHRTELLNELKFQLSRQNTK